MAKESTGPQAEAPSLRASAPKSSKVILSVLFICWCVDYIDRMMIAMALPFIGREFSLSHTQMGAVVSSFFVMYAIFQIPGGIMADKFGGKRTAAIAMVTWSALTAVTALTRGFASILAVRGLFGAAQAPFTGAAAKIVQENSSADKNMTGQGVISSANGIGGILSALIIPPAIALVGWRHTFLMAALLGAVCLFLILRFIPARTPSSAEQPRQAAAGPGLFTLVSSWTILQFALMAMGMGMIAWGISSWMPTYLLNVRGVSTAGSAAMLALPALMIALGTIVGGRIADKLDGVPRRVVSPAMAVAAMTLFAMANSSNLWVFLMWECVAIFSVGLCIIPVVSVPLKSLHSSVAGRTYAVVNFGAQIGGMIVPVLMGILVDHFGYTAAFLLLAFAATIATVMGLIVPQNAKKFAAAVSQDRRFDGILIESPGGTRENRAG